MASLPKLLLIGIIFLYSGLLYGQSIEKVIRGKVISPEMTPVFLATVSLYNIDNKLISSTRTDSTGTFQIVHNLKEKYYLLIRHLSYHELKSSLVSPANGNVGTVQLFRQENTLEAVEVECKRKLLSVDGGSVIYHIENSIAGQDISAFEALKRAPGVQIENETDITLNGKSGVQILLDGKQTFLSGKELSDLLKSMSSNNLKSIEILHSPSARYDATGAAGMINIKTKKNQTKGLNGTISTAFAYGTSPKQLETVGFNYRVNRINIFGTYNHTLGNYNYMYGTSRRQNGKSYDSRTIDVDKRQKMASQVGVDYFINDKNTVGFLANGNFIFGGGLTNTATAIATVPSTTVEETLDAINDYYGQQTKRYNFNLNYKYEDTLGHSLNVDADYGLFDKWNKNLQSNTYRDLQSTIVDENLYRTLNDIDIDLKGLKIDYTSRLWGGKLETGAKYSAVSSKNNTRFYHVTGSGDSLDNRRSNDFHFDERISSAYVDYQRSIASWSFQAGIRLESARSKGTLIYREQGADFNEHINRKFINLFPFVSVTRQMTNQQTLSLSYAKRIERPAYQDLNPFVYMLDELSFWKGNPFLIPSLTQRFTLLYSLKSSTIVALTYAYTDQLNAKVTDTLEQDKIMMISKNVGTQKHWSLSLTQTYSPKPWWDITFNGLLYYIHNDVSFDQYRDLSIKQTAGRVSLVQTFKLPLKIRGELSTVYNSKRLSGANTISRPISQVDIALQKPILKDKATIRVAITDIYKGNQIKYTQNLPGLLSSSYGYYESRQVRLSFSYRFSSGVAKDQRNRKSALESESGRIQ